MFAGARHLSRRAGWIALAGSVGSVSRAVRGALLAGTLVALGGAAAWIAFARWRFQFDPVYPGLCVIALYGATTLVNFMRAERDRAFIRNAFSRYISPA